MIKLIIFCPKCKGQHIDRDEWATEEKSHRKHLCEHCGEIFIVSEIHSVGVESL